MLNGIILQSQASRGIHSRQEACLMVIILQSRNLTWYQQQTKYTSTKQESSQSRTPRPGRKSPPFLSSPFPLFLSLCLSILSILYIIPSHTDRCHGAVGTAAPPLMPSPSLAPPRSKPSAVWPRQRCSRSSRRRRPCRRRTTGRSPPGPPTRSAGR